MNERLRPVKRAIRRLPTIRRPTDAWKTSTVARAGTRRENAKRTRRPRGRAFALLKPARAAHPAAEPVTAARARARRRGRALGRRLARRGRLREVERLEARRVRDRDLEDRRRPVRVGDRLAAGGEEVEHLGLAEVAPRERRVEQEAVRVGARASACGRCGRRS